jgi:copper(I)-binding protein
MKHQFAPEFRRVVSLAVSAIVLFAVVACAGTTAAGPMVEVEGAWARPSLAPIGHMDDHDHMDHHGPGEVEDDHGEEHMDAAAHHMSSGSTSAAYFVLHNRGGEADRLVSARTEVAGVVELHRSGIEDGVMRMRQVESIAIPANGEARLEPGGYHLMLIGVTRELRAGERFPITLEFERAGTQVVEVEVGSR